MSLETRAAPRAAAASSALPARRVDAQGRVRIDYRAIAVLALPLMLNSGLQAIVSLTDTWFVGHISTSAIAAMVVVYWVVLLFLVLVGGVGLAVQTFVAQAEGSRRRWRASPCDLDRDLGGRVEPAGLRRACMGGRPLFGAVGLDPEVERQAIEFWRPRMLGGPLGVAAWALTRLLQRNFAAARVGLTTGVVAIVNAVLNWLFVSSSAGESPARRGRRTPAAVCGVVVRAGHFPAPELRRDYKTHLTWRPTWRLLRDVASGCRWARCRRPICSACRCSS